MKLSIVTTLYLSEAYLRDFYRRIKQEAERITPAHEIIFVNDGSPDNSLELARAIQGSDSAIKIVDLSRNFGHHRAVMTGLSYAKGESVFLIDCDLEEDPELLGRFYSQFKGTDVVYGVQKSRKGGLFERFSGAAFYRLLSWLTDLRVPDNVIIARLMSRRYVDSLLRHQEKEVFLAGLLQVTGFSQTPVYVQKHSKGSSTYTVPKRIALFVNSITSFSDKPLVYIFYMGSLISFLAGLWSCDIIIRRLFFHISVTGWTSLIVSIWIMGGLTIFSLGVVGIYLSKVFIEIKNRPRTIVRDVFESH